MSQLNVEHLVEAGLVKKKFYPKTGLSLLKYTNKVFFKNLWHLDPLLLECRGTIIDEYNNIVVSPFRKIFNLGENNTTIRDKRAVDLVTKVNGFLGVATPTLKYGMLYSTTGTMDSEYAKMAEKHISKGRVCIMRTGITYLFEICDESDPHIVHEEEGAYLIGMREIGSGKLLSEAQLDAEAKILGFKRPEVRYRGVEMRHALKAIKQACHEGYMVLDHDTGKVLAKCKSPHYLTKKALMRVGKGQIKVLFNDTKQFKKRVDEEFYSLVDTLVATFTEQEWGALTEQERRAYFEGYFTL